MCEAEITEDNLLSGNKDASKELLKTFWEDKKDISTSSLKIGKLKGTLNILQKEAVTKVLEKKTDTKDT